MKRLTILKTLIIMSLSLFSVNAIYAKGGCCSSHGGVVGCDNATGHQLCKDNTASPSCACDGSNTKTTKTLKKPMHQQPSTLGSETTTTSATVPLGSNTMTPAATTNASMMKSKTTGCCSRHGGVAQCNKTSGYLTCKDGTQSTTCKCS